MSDDTLRERLREALVASNPVAVTGSDGTIKVVAERVVDALLPLIREHAAERPPTQYAYDQACKALHKHKERADKAEADQARIRPLGHAERAVYTVARNQISRGENPPINITAGLLIAVERLSGMDQQEATP